VPELSEMLSQNWECKKKPKGEKQRNRKRKQTLNTTAAPNLDAAHVMNNCTVALTNGPEDMHEYVWDRTDGIQ